jgi:poly(3-hydroxybutyrate) depolymerase
VRGRPCIQGFLQHAGFIAMNPSRHFMSHYDFYADLLKGDLEDADSHRKFYDEYNAVLDMPPSTTSTRFSTVFQQFSLPRGTWR